MPGFSHIAGAKKTAFRAIIIVRALRTAWCHAVVLQDVIQWQNDYGGLLLASNVATTVEIHHPAAQEVVFSLH